MTSDFLPVNAVNGTSQVANGDKYGATDPVNAALRAVPPPVVYAAAPDFGPAMLITCPKCQSHEVAPACSKHPLERLLKALNLPTYRCDHCSSLFRRLTTPAELRMLKREVLLRSAIRSLSSQTSM
jgi:hypothetical protein